MAMESAAYPARLDVDYPERLDRTTTFLRAIYVMPIAIVLGLLTGGSGKGGGGTIAGVYLASALMIVFRRRYPRWWFDFARECTRFGTRVVAYLLLLTDRYPSTVEEQSVHLDVEYPDVERLNRWLPLVKWFLAIPHYVVLALLILVALGGVVVAWFAILFTERYPKGIFDFVVGVGRWSLRVQAYAFLLVTDRYPPFSLS